MFALSEPSIKFDVPDIILTLVFVVIKLKKYIFFFPKYCMCGCAISKTYITFIHLEIQEHLYLEKKTKILKRTKIN